MRNFFILLLIFCNSAIFAQSNAKGVKWLSFEQVQEIAVKSPRITVVFLYVEQDEFCKLMDRAVFSDANVIATLNNEFYPVRFNGQESRTITFNGKKFSNLEDSYRLHRLVVPLLSSNHISFPALAFLNENNQLITAISGYQSVENLLEALSFIKRQYGKVNWDAHAVYPQAFHAWIDDSSLAKYHPQPQTVAQAKPQAAVEPKPEPAPAPQPEPAPAVEPTPEPAPAPIPVPVAENKPVSKPAPSPVSMTGVIKWYTMEEADKLCSTAPRKIFVDMYTDWCGWCKKMDRETFTDPTLANYLNENFYPVKFDAESRSPIPFNNKVYLSQQRTHDLALLLLQGQPSYPTFVILDQNRQTMGILKGYLVVEKLYQTLVYVGGDYYATSNDREFQSQWPKIKEETDKIYSPKH